MIRRALLVASLLLCACAGPGHVQYDNDRCTIDGKSATLSEVEARQAAVAARIQARQPWFAIVTLVVVIIAVASNAEKALVLFRARHKDGDRKLADRLRDALARQRERPLAWFAIVGGSLALLVLAAGLYIYLDADKRASERALGMLQFCHLALRTSEEQGVLDEQRRNLAAIESTAGDIRSLVDKLPPAEQHKAQLIINEMNKALTKQGQIVGEYMQRSDEASKLLKEHTAIVQKGLTSLETDLLALKSLPASLKEIGEGVKRVEGKVGGDDAKLAAVSAQLTDLDGKLKQLLARPTCEPPKPAAAVKPVAAAVKPAATDLGVGKP